MTRVLYANSLLTHLAENGPREAWQSERRAMELLGMGVYVRSGFIVILDRVESEDFVSAIFAQAETIFVES